MKYINLGGEVNQNLEVVTNIYINLNIKSIKIISRSRELS